MNVILYFQQCHTQQCIENVWKLVKRHLCIIAQHTDSHCMVRKDCSEKEKPSLWQKNASRAIICLRIFFGLSHTVGWRWNKPTSFTIYPNWMSTHCDWLSCKKIGVICRLCILEGCGDSKCGLIRCLFSGKYASSDFLNFHHCIICIIICYQFLTSSGCKIQMLCKIWRLCGR